MIKYKFTNWIDPTITEIKEELEEERRINKKLQNQINQAQNYINYIFDKGEDGDIIDELLELEKILNGELIVFSIIPRLTPEAKKKIKNIMEEESINKTIEDFINYRDKIIEENSNDIKRK